MATGEATICKLTNFRPIPGADRVQVANACGSDVVVGIDVSPDDLYIFFDCETQLSEEFCQANDLVARHDPTTGQKIGGGYFDSNRRVRAQKFRGVRSEGFVMEVESLLKLDILPVHIETLKVGDAFTEVAGIPICSKYITPATRHSQGANQSKQRAPKNICFPEHPETKQFMKEVGGIPEGSLIYLSEKCHGTSARYAYILQDYTLPLPWYLRVLNLLITCINVVLPESLRIWKRAPRIEKRYTHLVGTRRVIKTGPDGHDYHGSDAYRWDCMKDVWHLMHKGEILYGELVGYSSEGAPIMSTQSTEKCDKQVRKQYGPTMTYKYGCPAGTSRLLIYRITHINEDGIQFDLPWPAVKYRAAQLGLQTVPELSPYPGTDHFQIQEGTHHPGDPRISHTELTELVQTLVEGPSTLDPSHIREGVVVRVETPRGVYWCKHKSWLFRFLEGLVKDNPEYIDTEEAEG